MSSKQKTISGEIRKVAIVGIIIVVILMQVSAGFAIENALSNDLENEINLVSQSESNFVHNWLGGKVTHTEGLANGIANMPMITDEAAQAMMKKNVELDPDIMNLYLCRADKKYMVYNDGIFEIDPTTRPWWQDAWAANKTIITDAYVDANTGKIVVSVSTPFYLNNVQAVILADITLDQVIDQLRNVEDKNLSIMLVSADGTVVVHENTDFCMQSDGTATKITDKYAIDLSKSGLQSYTDENGAKQYVILHTVERTGWVLGAVLPNTYVMGRLLNGIIFGLVVGFVVMVIIITVLNRRQKTLLAPIIGMKKFIKTAVVGEENVPEYKSENQEIDFLVNELEQSFVATIRKTKNEMGSINASVKDTNKAVADIADSVNNISSVIEETVSSMDVQTENIGMINTDCNTISNASQAVADQAQEMSTKAYEIVEQVTALVPKMQAQKEAILKTREDSQLRLEVAVKEAECINEISNISEAIKAIASQTNLLSLNASIESARAGEAGKGFAVVAEEIRSLSDETNNEIDKISDLTTRLLKAVNTLSRECTDTVGLLSNNLEDVYNTLDDLAAEYKESAEYYADISAELGASSQELSASVQAVVSSVEDITASQRDVNTAMDSASSDLQNVALNATDMKTKAGDMADAVESVAESIEQFNV